MRKRTKALICLVSCIALALAARAANKNTHGAEADSSATSDNPYSAIPERNIFDLHDAPPPPPPPTTNPPPANIKLTGIATILGSKQALFIVTMPGSAGKPPKDQSYILNEGQRSGPLEVVEIDTKSRTAKIKNDGVEATLNIETNRMTTGGGMQAGMPGARGPGFAAPGSPGLPKSGFNQGNPYNSNPGTPLPTRPIRPEGVQPMASQQSPGGINLNGSSGFNNGMIQPVRQPVFNQDQQNVLIEGQRATGGPSAMILPPTALTPGSDSSGPVPGGGGAPNPGGSSLPPSLQPQKTGTFLVPR